MFWRTIAAALMIAVLAWPVQADARSRTLIRDAEIEQTLRAMSLPLFRAAGIPPSTVNISIIRDSSKAHSSFACPMTAGSRRPAAGGAERLSSLRLP